MNFSVDTNFYPLGSCTMKYNPKFTEKIAAMEGFTDLHPLIPQLRGGESLPRGLWRLFIKQKNYFVRLPVWMLLLCSL